MRVLNSAEPRAGADAATARRPPSAADAASMRAGPAGVDAGRTRRSDLAAFLRSRRARIRPEDQGLPQGSRRRTPGLRREEVAQLSGVGVTWYTWLEQGRPINVSVQVLDAIARTLRLDQPEREHLYHLAGVPVVPAGSSDGQRLGPEVQVILDGMTTLPACVVNDRFDLLAWNPVYASLWPSTVYLPDEQRNTLWLSFTVPACCNTYVNRGDNLPRMVAQLRSAYGQHIGEPAWTEFVRRLAARSAEFARMWDTHDVAKPETHVKVFRHAAFGEIMLASTSLAVSSTPGCRMMVYTPAGMQSRRKLDRIVAGEGADARFPCGHGRRRPDAG